MQKTATLEKDGKIIIVEDNVENLKCLHAAGWVSCDSTEKVVEEPLVADVATVTETDTIEVRAPKQRGRPRKAVLLDTEEV